MIRTMVGPFFDSHSDHEAMVRSPEETKAFYCAAAKGRWLEDLQKTCDFLVDLPSLRCMGFATDWSCISKRSSAEDLGLIPQTELAAQTADLCLPFLAKRTASMSWHAKS